MTEAERREAELRSIAKLTKGTLKQIEDEKKPEKKTKGAKK